MKVAPNETIVVGKVASARASESGGSEVELRVEANESPDAARDFIRPELGSGLTIFVPAGDEPPAPGARIRAKLALLAGPFGGRNVAREISNAD
jgi:hypothetical protein